MSLVPNVVLNNGVEIPQFGFGVFQVPPDETAERVTEALALGYRHIDTAERYENEAGVGAAIAASEIDRDELFITSKLRNSALTFDETLSSFDGTLEALGVDRVDLFLIHWPITTLRDFIPVWQAFERIYADGRARAIGVSNFHEHHLERLMAETEVTPAINQIEAHPYLVQGPLRAFNAAHGIATEAWSPLARGDVLGESVLIDTAARHGKSTAQVVLRWHIQLGSIVFPKTARPARMAENLAIFDFALSDEEMTAVSALDRDVRVGPNPDEFASL